MATRKDLLGAAAFSVQRAQDAIANTDTANISVKLLAITAFVVLGHLTRTLAAIVAWAAQIEAEFDPTEETPPEQQ